MNVVILLRGRSGSFAVNGINCGVIICEDMWDTVPFAESVEQGAELILVVNSSPFEVSKYEERLKLLAIG